jgi:predicted transcriptional regulator
MARTKKYTAKEVADALRQTNGVVARAAQTLGCVPSTVYRYADEYVTVQDAMDNARADLAAEAETHLVQMMRDSENPAQRYKATKDILRNYHPDDWSDKKLEQEHSSDGFTVQINPPDSDD